LIIALEKDFQKAKKCTTLLSEIKKLDWKGRHRKVSEPCSRCRNRMIWWKFDYRKVLIDDLYEFKFKGSSTNDFTVFGKGRVSDL
jgi:hypothetical protein